MKKITIICLFILYCFTVCERTGQSHIFRKNKETSSNSPGEWEGLVQSSIDVKITNWGNDIYEIALYDNEQAHPGVKFKVRFNKRIYSYKIGGNRYSLYDYSPLDSTNGFTVKWSNVQSTQKLSKMVTGYGGTLFFTTNGNILTYICSDF